MDVRLPLKRTRLATAYKVLSFANKFGHTKLAYAMEVAISRIKNELKPRPCGQCVQFRDTVPSGTDGSSHEGVYGDGRSRLNRIDDEDDDNTNVSDEEAEGQRPGQHLSILQHDITRSSVSKRLPKESETEAKRSHRSERQLGLRLEDTKAEWKMLDSPHLAQAPKLSFKKGLKKGLAAYVRDIVLPELANEVEECVERHMGSIHNLTQSSRGQARGRDRRPTEPSRNLRGRRHARGRSQDQSDAPTPDHQNIREVRAREQGQQDIIQKNSVANEQPPSEPDKGKPKKQSDPKGFPEQYASGANGPGPIRYTQRLEPSQMPTPSFADEEVLPRKAHPFRPESPP
jgi:hypothetical protein